VRITVGELLPPPIVEINRAEGLGAAKLRSA
jgi:hypothetical protein